MLKWKQPGHIFANRVTGFPYVEALGPFRSGSELILATKPYAKDSAPRSWWYVLSTGALLVLALAGTLFPLHSLIRLFCSIVAGLLICVFSSFTTISSTMPFCQNHTLRSG